MLTTLKGLFKPDGTADGTLREISDTFDFLIFGATTGILSALEAPTTTTVEETNKKCEPFGFVSTKKQLGTTLLILTRLEWDKALELSW